MRSGVRAVFSVMLMVAATGCSDYLSNADDDPNSPNTLTRPGPLYVAIQSLQAVQFEGQLARTAAEYMQQVAGIDRQQRGYDLYGIDPTTIDPSWYSVYASSRSNIGGGGLLDIRKMQQIARGVNDSIYIGIGKVYEALVIGMAASVWGDIPYREAADSTKLTPAFDPQQQVYADVLLQLDSAIMFLAATPGGTNLGPKQDNAELIYRQYAGDVASLAAVYTKVAHSLKARYYLHLAERDPSNYARAFAVADSGINTPDDDMLWYHDVSPTGQNLWWQFMDFRGDIGPGAAIIEILKRRNDNERLNFYFTQAQDDDVDVGFYGFRPGGVVMTTGGGVYDGSGSPVGGAYSDFNFINPGMDDGDLRMPIITYAETQLIMAEAAFRTSGTGTAQEFLDAARANRSYGARGLTPVEFTPLGSVPATLENIMEEKYVTLFLNIESWNDYKRTCLPSLAPAPDALTSSTPGVAIPGRLPYGVSDLNANPNTPAVSNVGRNWNDPNPCSPLNYVGSTPLGN